MADHLTSEQIAEIKETFSLFDKGGVGTITLDEMGIIVRALGQTPSQAELEIMKKEADPDESGRVDYPEFLSVFAKYQKEPVSEQEIMNSFEELDDLKKGTITIKKLRYLMSTCGEILTEEEIQKMIHYANPDHEGFINYRDFVKLMMSK
jgi:Ca2+-binding protein (EF-Hand superfamily)